MNPAFWEKLDQLIANHEIRIDRPRGSAHPRYPELIYGVDYGYLAGTSAADGEGIDLFLGTSGEKRLTGLVVCVDMEKAETEIKLLIGVTEAELSWIMNMVNETDSMKGLLINREGEREHHQRHAPSASGENSL